MIDRYGSDDELMSRLGSLLAQVDPVPSAVIDAARASATWRTIDSELAALRYDSVLDRNEWAGVRGGGSRWLSFTSPNLTIELEVLGGRRAKLVGQVEGAGTGRVEICYPDATFPVETDRVGQFSCPSHPGPMSVRVTDDATGTVTQTEWVVI
jgi:hypothetical protein